MAPSMSDQVVTTLSSLYHNFVHSVSRPSVLQPLAVLGGLTTLYAVNKLFWVAQLFLRPSSLPRSLHPSRQPYLTYALVTGASDGIGRELCFELARRGFALVLHGRNSTKLNAMADEMQAQFKDRGMPRPLIIVAHADRCDQIDFAALVKPLRKLRLTVLVNNVGAQGHLSDNPYDTVTNRSREDLERLIDLNARFMTMLTRELIPQILKSSDPAASDDEFEYPVPLERKLPGKAPTAQILMASSAAAVGIPYVTTYAGTKGYVESFSKGLRMELLMEGYSSTRVQVLCLRIGNVQTSTNPLEVRLTMPTAADYAKAICNRVGCGRALIVPYFWHWVQIVFFAELATQGILEWGIMDNIKFNMVETKRINDAKRGKKEL